MDRPRSKVWELAITIGPRQPSQQSRENTKNIMAVSTTFDPNALAQEQKVY